MILVTLGTQDKTFKRLLEYVDELIERHVIVDKVVVQSGSTEYESTNMEVFSSIPKDQFMKYLDDADIIITHGGVGSIFDGLKRNKKIISVPRLEKYMEHHNDHQVQVVSEFKNNGYIMMANDIDELEECLKNIDSFVPNKYTSNNDNMISLLSDYIDNNKGRGFFRFRKNK